jgi:hypothetical protein
MAYLGEVKLEEFMPNHPFAHGQVIFGMKRPSWLKEPSTNHKPGTTQAHPDSEKAEAVDSQKAIKQEVST